MQVHAENRGSTFQRSLLAPLLSLLQSLGRTIGQLSNLVDDSPRIGYWKVEPLFWNRFWICTTLLHQPSKSPFEALIALGVRISWNCGELALHFVMVDEHCSRKLLYPCSDPTSTGSVAADFPPAPQCHHSVHCVSLATNQPALVSVPGGQLTSTLAAKHY